MKKIALPLTLMAAGTLLLFRPTIYAQKAGDTIRGSSPPLELVGMNLLVERHNSSFKAAAPDLMNAPPAVREEDIKPVAVEKKEDVVPVDQQEDSGNGDDIQFKLDPDVAAILEKIKSKPSGSFTIEELEGLNADIEKAKSKALDPNSDQKLSDASGFVKAEMNGLSKEQGDEPGKPPEVIAKTGTQADRLELPPENVEAITDTTQVQGENGPAQPIVAVTETEPAQNVAAPKANEEQEGRIEPENAVGSQIAPSVVKIFDIITSKDAGTFTREELGALLTDIETALGDQTLNQKSRNKLQTALEFVEGELGAFLPPSSADTSQQKPADSTNAPKIMLLENIDNHIEALPENKQDMRKEGVIETVEQLISDQTNLPSAQNKTGKADSALMELNGRIESLVGRLMRIGPENMEGTATPDSAILQMAREVKAICLGWPDVFGKLHEVGTLEQELYDWMVAIKDGLNEIMKKRELNFEW